MKLIPLLLLLAALAIILPLFDYYNDGQQGWLSAVGVAPAVVFLVYYVAAGLLGWRRDSKSK